MVSIPTNGLQEDILSKKLITVLVFSLSLTLGTRCYAGTALDQLHIKAHVASTFEYDILKEPDTLNIKSVDIKKGYTELKNSTYLYISTNNQNGFVVSVCAQEINAFTLVEVTDGDGYYQLYPDDCIDIFMLNLSTKDKKIKLDYNFHILPSAMAGEYPWPISVIASSL
jgi:hypothetical protein